MLYPVLLHYGITELVGGGLLLYWTEMYDNGIDIYYQNAIVIIGVTGILAMIPAVFFYRRDRRRRVLCGVTPPRMGRIPAGDGVLLLGVGAALGLYGNLLMSICQLFLQSTVYQESMEQISQGKGILMMIFWMGIIAPMAEEVVFRWLIFLRLRDYMRLPAAAAVSGLIFGIYHGNILQAVYATLLGFMFAYFLEMTGNLLSCMLLHMGANIWVLLYPEILLNSPYADNGFLLLVMLLFLLIVLVFGIWYFFKSGRDRNRRMV